MRLTIWPTGMPTSSFGGFAPILRLAYALRMNCRGIGRVPGDSGASHASVHAVRSCRAGLPVKARDRTVSLDVAFNNLSVTTPDDSFSATVSQIEPVHTPAAPRAIAAAICRPE